MHSNIDSTNQDCPTYQCPYCNSKYGEQADAIIWDEHGYGYSTKMCRCPHCGKINSFKYYEDSSLNLNRDTRWYK